MVTVLHDEQFTGAQGDPWPSPWAKVELDGSGFLDQDGLGDGRIVGADAAGFKHIFAHLDDAALDGEDLRGTVTFQLHPGVSVTRIAGVVLRYDPVTHERYEFLYVHSDGLVSGFEAGTYVRIRHMSDATTVVSQVTQTVAAHEDVDYTLTAEAANNQLQLKAWKASEAEPSLWTLETVDDIVTSGRGGVLAAEGRNRELMVREFQLHDITDQDQVLSPSDSNTATDDGALEISTDTGGEFGVAAESEIVEQGDDRQFDSSDSAAGAETQDLAKDHVQADTGSGVDAEALTADLDVEDADTGAGADANVVDQGTVRHPRRVVIRGEDRDIFDSEDLVVSPDQSVASSDVGVGSDAIATLEGQTDGDEPEAPAELFIAYRANCGGGDVADDGLDWSADDSHLITDGTTTVVRDTAVTSVEGIPDAVLQATRNSGGGNTEIRWRFDISEPGEQHIRWVFCETLSGVVAGERIIDLLASVDGGEDLLIDTVDPTGDAGFATALVIDLPITATATVDVVVRRAAAASRNPTLQGIEILSPLGSDDRSLADDDSGSGLESEIASPSANAISVFDFGVGADGEDVQIASTGDPSERVTPLLVQAELDLITTRVNGGGLYAGTSPRTNAPNDWSRIVSFRDNRVSNPNATHWSGPTKFASNGCIIKVSGSEGNTSGQNPTEFSRGVHRTSDCALHGLITGNTTSLSVARNWLLDEFDITDGTKNFNNRSRFCLTEDSNPGSFGSPWFDIANWCSSGAIATSYLLAADALTAAERDQILTCLYWVADWQARTLDNRIGTHYDDRPNLTLKSGGQPGNTSTNLCCGLLNAYDGGPTVYAFPRFTYHNRASAVARTAALVAHLLEMNPGFNVPSGISGSYTIAQLKTAAARFYREWMTFGTYGVGASSDFHRASESVPTQGHAHYAAKAFMSMLMIGTLFARAGDRSLIDFETNVEHDPGGSSDAGPNTKFVAQQKSALWYALEQGKYAGTTYARFVGSSRLNFRSSNKHYVSDVKSAAILGRHFSSSALTDVLHRSQDGAVSYPSSPSSTGHGMHGWRAEWDLHNAVMLFYADTGLAVI